MEEEGSLCQTCFVGTLHLSAGILVCETCGMTQQSFLEETQEYQGTQRRTAVRTGPSQQRPVWKRVEERAELPIREGIEAYIHMFQDLLQLQVSQITHFGLVSDHIPRAVSEIWFLHIQRTKVLEPLFYQEVESDVRRSNSKVIDTESPIQFSKTSAVVASHLNRCLPLSLSLSILFLGCWITRETIDPYDITRLAACGHLEYMGVWKRYKHVLEPYLSVFSKSFFCPTGVSGPAKIYLEARKLAAFLRIESPPLNRMAWYHRYVHALHIPEDLLAPLSICEILYTGPVNSVENYMSHETKTPWATLASIVAFYLDVILQCSTDRGNIDRSIRSCFQDIMDAGKLMPNNISSLDILQMSPGNLSHFLKFLRTVYFQFEGIEKLDFILQKIPVEEPQIQLNCCRQQWVQEMILLGSTPEIRLASSQHASLSTLQLSLTYLSWGAMKETIQVSVSLYISFEGFQDDESTTSCADKPKASRVNDRKRNNSRVQNQFN